MKTGTDFDQRGQSTVDRNRSAIRTNNPREKLEYRTFPCTVGADDSHRLPLGDIEIQITHGPKLGRLATRRPITRASQDAITQAPRQTRQQVTE